MNKLVILYCPVLLLLGSCKKEGKERLPLSSITYVNAAINIASAKVYTADHAISWAALGTADAVAAYKSGIFGVLAGSNMIRAVSLADTTIMLYSSPKQEAFRPIASNTLFLCGEPGSYGAVFIGDDQVVNHTDSIMGIRFINLSPNSAPVHISLVNGASNEATALAYRDITNFKWYPAHAAVPSMVFEVKDASTGDLLATYTLPVTPHSSYPTVGIPKARFKNITLVVKGLAGTASGTNAFGVFPVPHY